MRIRLRRVLTMALLATCLSLAAAVSSALASTQQLSMFEDDAQLHQDPIKTLDTMRALGVGIVRVYVQWNSVATNSRPANPSDSASYPAGNWAIYDTIDREAAARGIAVDFTISGPTPRWATGAGAPGGAPTGVWKPAASQFGQFVRAVGTRYSGHYGGLPRVSTWAIWNEPNFGKDLAPQAINGSAELYSPALYRQLVDAGWGAFRATGHGRDTILIGSLAARGFSGRPRANAPEGYPGNFSTAKPLQFVRWLYCLAPNYKPLRGRAASLTGCPTNAAGSRRFRGAHPGLFGASGFAQHPYPVNLNPTKASSPDRDYVEYSDIPHLESALDRAQRAYRSGRRFRIYVTEYGYVTNPPNHSNHYVNAATAAFYDNWAEYLSWRSPRIATTMQYLLQDPNPRGNVPEFGGFASGLEYFGGRPKPIGGGVTMLDSYRLPLFMPVTSSRRGRALEVWGAVRPSRYARIDTGRLQSVRIEIQPHSRGPFLLAKTVTISNPRGYFDTRIPFSVSGTVRLAWIQPAGGLTAFSRSQRISIH